MYQIELIWNRETNWVRFSKPKNTLGEAKLHAISIRDSGDGARVKKIRIINEEDEILWTG